MHYLTRGRDRRADPRLVMPTAQSIFTVMLPYRKTPAGSTDPSRGPRYARYLHGRDYHLDMTERLERVAIRARQETGAPLEFKACVDTSAVLERSWAALAGLGWIGKNTLLIHPKLGSYFFLGSLLLSEPLGRGPSPLPDYCGSCTRCLHACPTRALPAPRELDSNRCISYWTLEKRGDLTLNAADQKAMGTWIAGCDLCQEVCPFNLKAARAETSPPPDPGAIGLDDWESLTMEAEADYRVRVRESSLNRVKPAQFARNLTIARANSRGVSGPQ
jgi:epoxyqueuosine reductase